MGSVHVVIAPVPSESALAWVDHARKALSLVGQPGFPVTVPPDVLDAYGGYLEEWFWAADRGPEFQWAGDADPEVVCHLMHHWFQLVQHFRAHGGGPARPESGDQFYRALVTAVTDALAREDCTHLFGEDLRSAWPGLPA